MFQRSPVTPPPANCLRQIARHQRGTSAIFHRHVGPPPASVLPVRVGAWGEPWSRVRPLPHRRPSTLCAEPLGCRRTGPLTRVLATIGFVVRAAASLLFEWKRLLQPAHRCSRFLSYPYSHARRSGLSRRNTEKSRGRGFVQSATGAAPTALVVTGPDTCRLLRSTSHAVWRADSSSAQTHHRRCRPLARPLLA